ncbi:MAG: LptF/LptG family permease [Candidatus Hydrogenedentales bacterium]|jgi:lipopolysaccharide export LptBFGC system permease protein LptF
MRVQTLHCPFKTLHRYVLREIAIPSVLAFALISFLAIGNELRERVEQLPIEHISPLDILRLTAFFLPSVVPFIIPITYMMGLLLAFGQLNQQNEIIAMKAAGIPLKRVVIPVLLGGALLSAAAFVIQDRVQPFTFRSAMLMITRELPSRLTLDVLPAGVMHELQSDQGVWRIYIERKDAETGTLHNIELLMPRKEDEAWTFFAREAQIITRETQTEIILRDGYSIYPQDEGEQLLVSTFPEFRVPWPQSLPGKLPQERRTLNLAGCLAAERELNTLYEARRTDKLKGDLREMRHEISERISLPMLSFAVSVLAAPLAVRSRHGGRSYSFAIGFLILLIYIPLTMLLEPQSLRSLGTVILRGMVPNLVLLAAGCVALWRVDRI